MVDIEIEYEVTPEHNAHAVKMADALLAQFGKQVTFIKLIPSHEGKFDIAIDGEITYTLMMENRLPGIKEICDQVHERLRTTAPGVWAVGDCAGSPHFTHIADDDVRVVRDNLVGIDRTTIGRLVPFCLFTDPELPRVGLSESEAKSRGIAYRLTKIPVTAVLRSRTLSEPRGFYKALVATDSDRILGFTAFAPEAGEVMTIVQIAITAGLPYMALRDAILTHPTMAEGLAALFRGVKPQTNVSAGCGV